MKIIGNRDLFAIRFEIESMDNNYVYGNFCFIIGSKEVGNYSTLSTLSIINSNLKDFLKQKEQRTYPQSENLKPEELFFKLHGTFFSNNYNESSNMMGQFRSRFWLDDIGEYSFQDQFCIILVDEPNLSRQRLLWKKWESEKVMEQILPINHFDIVGKNYLKKFSETINLF